MKKISIIFSFYNEEATIDFSTQKIINILNENNEIDYEVIFVNDNSNDNSLDKIIKLRENNKKILFLTDLFLEITSGRLLFSRNIKNVLKQNL